MGLCSDVLSEWFGDIAEKWTDEGYGKHGVKHAYQSAQGVWVKDYLRDWSRLELTGKACEVVGADGLSRVVAGLCRLDRWRCTRIDFAWDGCPFSVDDVYAALVEHRVRIGRGGPTNGKPLYYENELGQTVYINSRQSERFARVYNKRGTTRFELVLQDKSAEWAALQLSIRPPEQWASVAHAWAVDWLSLHAAPANAKGQWDRVPLSPEWAAFVGQTARVKLERAAPTADELPAVATALLAVQRSARRLLALEKVAGRDFVWGLLNQYGRKNWTPADDRYVEELKRYTHVLRQMGDFSAPDDVPF